MCSGGCVGCISFRDIKRVSVLIGLKLTSQFLAHFVIFSRSELRVCAAVSGFSTTIKRLVSSAKSLMFD